MKDLLTALKTEHNQGGPMGVEQDGFKTEQNLWAPMQPPAPPEAHAAHAADAAPAPHAPLSALKWSQRSKGAAQEMKLGQKPMGQLLAAPGETWKSERKVNVSGTVNKAPVTRSG